MADEEHHIDFLETQLELVAKLSLELFAQHHFGEMGEGGQDGTGAAVSVNNFLIHESLRARAASSRGVVRIISLSRVVNKHG